MSRMQSGKKERVAGKKKKKRNSAKFYPVTTNRKNPFGSAQDKTKKEDKKAQDVKYTYISQVGIYV